jgi:hypothetical protein
MEKRTLFANNKLTCQYLRRRAFFSPDGFFQAVPARPLTRGATCLAGCLKVIPKRNKRKLIGWCQNNRKEELRFSVSAGATF